MTLERIVDALGGKKEGSSYRCECPIHGGKHLIAGMRSDKLVVHCKGGGATQSEVWQALAERGLVGEPATVAAPGRQPTAAPRQIETTAPELVEEYHYRGSEGECLAVKGRFITPAGTKTFRWRMPDDPDWKGLKGIKEKDLPLYGSEHLPKAGDRPIIVVEGEKAVRACWRQKLIAVCLPGGAASKDFGSALSPLADKDVILWADSDPEGRQLAYRLKQALGLAGSVVEFCPPMPGKGDDAFDYFSSGKTAADFMDEVKAIPNKPWVEPTAMGYQVSIPDSGGYLRFAFDGLRQQRTRDGSALQADVTTWQDLPQQTNGRFGARLNLKSVSGRNAYRLHLDDVFADQPKGYWAHNLDMAVQLVQDAYRASDPSIDLGLVSCSTTTEYLLWPLLLSDAPTILFGPGESGKTYLALLVGLAVAVGAGLFGAPCEQRRVVYVDYEATAEQIKRRLLLLASGLGVELGPTFFRDSFLYLPGQGRALADMAPALEQQKRKGAGLVIVDSVALACGGSPKEEELAVGYFNTLGGLKLPSLNVAHVTKDESGKNPDHPFGSIFWHLSARLTWYVKTHPEAEQNPKHLALICKKSNEDIRHRPLGVEVKWDGDAVRVRKEDVSEEFHDMLSIPERVRRRLNGPAQTVRQLATSMGLKEDLVRARLNQMKGVMALERGEDGTMLWGLATDRRDDGS